MLEVTSQPAPLKAASRGGKTHSWAFPSLSRACPKGAKYSFTLTVYALRKPDGVGAAEASAWSTRCPRRVPNGRLRRRLVTGDEGRSPQAADANYHTNPLAPSTSGTSDVAYGMMSQPSTSRASAATPSCWTNCPTSTSSDFRVLAADVRTPATETAAASVAQRSP